MTDKDLLLSKLYDDNTVCYRVNIQEIWITNRYGKLGCYWVLDDNYFLLSHSRVWYVLEDKYLNKTKQQINDLIEDILEDQLKRKGLGIRIF